MTRFVHTSTFLASLLILSACSEAGEEPKLAVQTEAASAVKAVAGHNGPIPGPRNCFWLRGPHSGDPYINLAYPDANVFYWAGIFTIPDGASLRLEGTYPHSRYMSFISYDQRGRPVESLADYLIVPDRVPEVPGERMGFLKNGSLPNLIPAAYAAQTSDEKSINPYVPGNARNSDRRQYSIEVINKQSASTRTTGERSKSDTGNVLHAPSYGPGQQLVIYRIYLPDAGTAPGGGAALPNHVVTLADGTVLSGEEACNTLKTRQPLAISLDAVGIPPLQFREMINQPDKPDTWPAHNPAAWFIQLDRQSLIGMYTGNINPDAKRSEGGFYPNLDNHYIRTIVNRKHGHVFMIRGRAPTTPNTVAGNAVMGDGQLRYWSVCSNQSFANTRVNDCVFDEEIPLDARGFYTIMISREADRPRNAIKECGIAWLPMADNGDGIFDDDATIVQIRHMLTADDFPHSIQRVDRQEDLIDVMGPYMPRTRYLMPNQVETFFPCLLETND